MSRYTSNLKVVKVLMDMATMQGLEFAANQIRNRVVLGLRGGYTSGQFVTGTNTGSVVTTEPQYLGMGRWRILIGTSINDPPYPLYWELGHFNIFSRKFERKEVWGPALADGADAARKAFARGFNRSMAGVRVSFGDMGEAAD